MEKSRKERRGLEYEVAASFRDRMLWEKFGSKWINKKVVNGRCIDLLELNECGWDILCFVKKQKWRRLFNVHEPIYSRPVRAFFIVVVVDSRKLTLKANLKGNKIQISK